MAMAMMTTACGGPKQPQLHAKMMFTWKKDKHLPLVKLPIRGEKIFHLPMKRKRDDPFTDESPRTITSCQP